MVYKRNFKPIIKRVFVLNIKLGGKTLNKYYNNLQIELISYNNPNLRCKGWLKKNRIQLKKKIKLKLRFKIRANM